MSKGITSYVSTGICIGLVSQLWLRQYHPVWYRKYNFILGGAFDGGAQVMIFILSFAYVCLSHPYEAPLTSAQCIWCERY